MKSAEYVRAQIALLEELGREHLVSAGKDISNPGVIGTLGMLLEVSNKGAVIDLDAIPRPDLNETGISFEQWVRMYPGMGFILTMKKEHVEEVCTRFSRVGITARDIGVVDTSRNLTIAYKEKESQVFDFSKNGIYETLYWPGRLRMKKIGIGDRGRAGKKSFRA